MSTVFLGMNGMSPTLLEALECYLHTCFHDSDLNASNEYRKIISNFIHVTIFEEDRKFYSKSLLSLECDDRFHGKSRQGSIINELLEVSRDLLSRNDSLWEEGSVFPS